MCTILPPELSSSFGISVEFWNKLTTMWTFKLSHRWCIGLIETVWLIVFPILSIFRGPWRSYITSRYKSLLCFFVKYKTISIIASIQTWSHKNDVNKKCGFFLGNLKPVIKSQRDPPKAKAGKIQVVTGNTFDKYVMDETKEVFIEFYAPWCGHCKAIVSLYLFIFCA